LQQQFFKVLEKNKLKTKIEQQKIAQPYQEFIRKDYIKNG